MLTMSYLPLSPEGWRGHGSFRRRRPAVAGRFRQHVVLFGWKWLFHHLHPKTQEMRGEIGIDPGRPALVGIDDDRGVRSAAPHGLQPRHVIGRAEFDFQRGR
jgi:hypothetical protein